MNALLVNWQPTLAGAVAALGAYFVTLPEPWHTIGIVLAALGTVALGAASKQHNVTGGTVPTTPEATARLAAAPQAAPAAGTGGAPPPSSLVLLLAVGALFLGSGCAALSKASGSTGPIDMGHDVACSITASPTDPTSCTKGIAQTCQVPLPKNAAGECILDAINLDIPFQPGKGATCRVSAAAGPLPCTKTIATSCIVPIPRDAATGACP